MVFSDLAWAADPAYAAEAAVSALMAAGFAKAGHGSWPGLRPGRPFSGSGAIIRKGTDGARLALPFRVRKYVAQPARRALALTPFRSGLQPRHGGRAMLNAKRLRGGDLPRYPIDARSV